MDYELWTSQPQRGVFDLDPAHVNLCAALGLPGSEQCDIPRLLSIVDHWAEIVAVNTSHWQRNFVPDDGCQTLAQFRMMAMLTVVQRDFGVRYDASSLTALPDATDSRTLFIHGPLTGCGGTCSSLPVLYQAIGHRLGYPLFLVEAKEHLFLRWDDGVGERFNVECAGTGFSTHSDEHYKQWPFPLSRDELSTGYYLQNFSRQQEIAHSIATRGHCLLDNLRIDESLEAYWHASRLDRRYSAFSAVTTIIQRIVLKLSANCFLRDMSLLELIRLASPKPVLAWERWAVPVAQKELERIISLPANRSQSTMCFSPDPTALETFYSSI